MTTHIIPTVVPKSLADVVGAHERYREFATSLHIDVANGEFAPNSTWLPTPFEKLPDADSMMYEAHLMVAKPRSIGISFADAGARSIIVHAETLEDAAAAEVIFKEWRAAGIESIGIALLLVSPLKVLLPYISTCDYVLLMTIATIGTQGIPFDSRGIERVTEMHSLYPELVIAVDGGENEEHIRQLAMVGATRFVVGSALSSAENPEVTYAQLVKAAETPPDLV